MFKINMKNIIPDKYTAKFPDSILQTRIKFLKIPKFIGSALSKLAY